MDKHQLALHATAQSAAQCMLLADKPDAGNSIRDIFFESSAGHSLDPTDATGSDEGPSRTGYILAYLALSSMATLR